CLVAGRVSGNLEMLDFDLGGEAFQPWYTSVERADPGLLSRLVMEQSPSGGWHVAYRSVAPVCGNLKLAQRRQVADGPDEVTIRGKTFKPRQDTDGHWQVLLTLIETRGEGGLFLCAPSPGYELLQGDFAQLPLLGESEREILLEAAWSLNQHVPEPTGHATDPEARPPASSDSGDTTGGRPGDEYNQRGDVRALLRRHGWTLVKGGENEYWRRPGKTSGWSATLKDGVLFVFSQNAAPFEANQPYAPFSVYTLLEHHGDFAAAASALRQEGFGGDPVETGDVDLTGVEKQCRLGDMRSFFGVPVADEPPEPSEEEEPRKPKQPAIPDELLRVPGFVGGVMDFCMSGARYPNLPMAFCGAMALQSFLCSRKVRDRGGLRPNLYVLALADSGVGKAYPRKINSYVLGQIGLRGAVGNQIGSGQGLEDEIQSHRKKLYQTDEIDHLLRCLSTSKESYHSMLLTLILELYTAADENHVMRSKARVRGQTDADKEVDQPGLVIFGTATPDSFYGDESQTPDQRAVLSFPRRRDRRAGRETAIAGCERDTAFPGGNRPLVEGVQPGTSRSRHRPQAQPERRASHAGHRPLHRRGIRHDGTVRRSGRRGVQRRSHRRRSRSGGYLDPSLRECHPPGLGLRLQSRSSLPPHRHGGRPMGVHVHQSSGPPHAQAGDAARCRQPVPWRMPDAPSHAQAGGRPDAPP
ncbi:MAG TPA: hypothetical protein PLT20_09845, partial [Sedimentisphaerales bacterium]|nr:hypothetical protein [Sedimentisphaerales bacterium]